MSCNLLTNEDALRAAFNQVSNSTTGSEWAIFEYDGQTSIITVGETGEGGLPELTQALNPAKVQYGFATVQVPGLTQRKVILIHWQGGSVPATKLANTATNVNEVKHFFKKVNLTINARSEDDVDLSYIQYEVSKLSAGVNPIASPSSHTMFEIPAPIGTAYTPVKPHTDIDLQEREKFWKEQQLEEEERRREEIKRNEERTKLFQMERKQLETKLHQTHINAQAPKQQYVPPLAALGNAPKKSTLITGRTQLFEQKVLDLLDTSVKPSTKPKNFKYEVAVSKPLGTPVNREIEGQNGGSVAQNVNVDASPSKSAAEIKKQFSESSVPTSPTSPTIVNNNNIVNKPAPPPLPTSPPPAGNRVLALWDYQANEPNEISFNPDDIITEVERLHEGWWKGRAPNGQLGLFPSNFVKPL
uniref:Drebrin-like protein n=1 Tax=Panagrellus redivivus TaxID=6233 RepID=A0A7E4USP3_PANRE